MILLAFKVATVFYAVVALLGIAQLVRPGFIHHRALVICLAVATCFHFSALVQRGMILSGFPVGTFHDGLSLFAFVASVIAIGIGWRGSVPQLVPMAAILVAILMMIANSTEPAAAQIPESLRSRWLPIHIATSFLGYALFMVAGLVSVVYLVQERRLKAKKARVQLGLGPKSGLPSLEALDRLSLRLIEFGFPLLTLGLITGSLYGEDVWRSFLAWDPRIVSSLFVWVLYALLLNLRLTIGWRGRRLALLTVLGVVATLVSQVGLTHAWDYVL